MNWGEALDPNYVNSELLGDIGTEKVVTIVKVEQNAEYYDQKTQRKETGLAVHFAETKPLLLNATNTKTLMRLFGGATEDVSRSYGHRVILYVTETKVAGKKVPCIRIKEFSETKCEGCGEVILPTATRTVDQLVDISKRNCEGKALCIKCMNKYKEEHTS